MCRLLGFVSNDEHTISEIAGANFETFSALSAKHGDGWGVASIDNHSHTNLIVEPTRAKESAKFAEVTSSLKSDGALLHLRWATQGLQVNEGNSHPFTFGDISFMHNGDIKPAASLDPFVDPELKSAMRGDTDSERYFYSIISASKKSNLIEGALEAVRKIKEKLFYSSINAMLLTPDKYIVISEHNNDRIPEGEGADYYELYYRKDAKGILVSSTGWDQSGWTLIPNHSMAVIDRKSLAVEVISL
jgi:predicted glutamine amidotransferase